MFHNKRVSGKIVWGLSFIMIMTLLAYFVVLCNPLFVSKKIFWSIYLLFNFISFLLVFASIRNKMMKHFICAFISLSIFNIITFFHPNRFMFTMHSGDYSFFSQIFMIIPGVCGICYSLFLMYRVILWDKVDWLAILMTIVLIFLSAIFFAEIYSYTYEEFYHCGYDLFIDKHISAVSDATNQSIFNDGFVLYSFDCMLGRNFSNIELSYIVPPEMLNPVQYGHIGSYDAANRWLLFLKVVSEVESFVFVLYITFIVAENFQLVMKKREQ